MGNYAKVRQLGPLYRFAYVALSPYFRSRVRLHVEGLENLPATGGVILAPNHISNFDPLNIGYVCGINSREVYFMAKSELFKVPLLGSLLRAWGMIPVNRKNGAARSLVAAEEALGNGQTVCIFAEGTITRDPAYWPMRGKTGAARLALDSGAPLVPLVQWGTHNIMERFSGRLRLKRTDVWVRALPPVEVADLVADSSDHEAVHEVTHRLQSALIAGLADVRGEIPPTEIMDPAQGAPEKADLGRLSAWRRTLAKSTGRQEILPGPRR